MVLTCRLCRYEFLTLMCILQAVARYAAGRADFDETTYSPSFTWRAAEAVAGKHLPVGAAVSLRGDECIAGDRGIAHTSEGNAFHIEHVKDDELEGFLQRRMPAPASKLQERLSLSLDERERTVPAYDLCRDGRFLLIDPRVGLFNNQRYSYEHGLEVAALLDRTLVMPGFFKLPHPRPYDGAEWVPVRDLFDWETLRRCNADIIELRDLIEMCGADLLDHHVTVPFETMWMRSESRAPWINETRRELRWLSSSSSDSGQTLETILRSREMRPLVPLKYNDYLWRLIRPFLEDGVAATQVVRVHGMIAPNTSLHQKVCFFPAPEIVRKAEKVFEGWSDDLDEPATLRRRPRVLGLHLRVFKEDVGSSGGYLEPEMANQQKDTCNLEPDIFQAFVLNAIHHNFNNFWPTHTYVASNEANVEMVLRYSNGMPGVRINTYSPAQYAAAATIAECTDALQSILIDALLLTWADYFVGNVCSSMSQLVFMLRLHISQPFNSTLLLGGEWSTSLRETVKDILDATG